MQKLAEKIKEFIVSSDSGDAAERIVELLRTDGVARRQLLYGITPYICPYFASCATPNYWGKEGYLFITKVCLTKEHANCLHKVGSLDQCKIDVVEDGKISCPRLARCLCKIKKPIEEFIMIVCATEEHRKCAWYVAWHYRGEHVDDDMESVKAVPEDEE